MATEGRKGLCWLTVPVPEDYRGRRGSRWPGRKLAAPLPTHTGTESKDRKCGEATKLKSHYPKLEFSMTLRGVSLI